MGACTSCVSGGAPTNIASDETPAPVSKLHIPDDVDTQRMHATNILESEENFVVVQATSHRLGAGMLFKAPSSKSMQTSSVNPLASASSSGSSNCSQPREVTNGDHISEQVIPDSTAVPDTPSPQQMAEAECCAPTVPPPPLLQTAPAAPSMPTHLRLSVPAIVARLEQLSASQSGSPRSPAPRAGLPPLLTHPLIASISKADAASPRPPAPAASTAIIVSDAAFAAPATQQDAAVGAPFAQQDTAVVAPAVLQIVGSTSSSGVVIEPAAQVAATQPLVPTTVEQSMSVTPVQPPSGASSATATLPAAAVLEMAASESLQPTSVQAPVQIAVADVPRTVTGGSVDAVATATELEMHDRSAATTLLVPHVDGGTAVQSAVPASDRSITDVSPVIPPRLAVTLGQSLLLQPARSPVAATAAAHGTPPRSPGSPSAAAVGRFLAAAMRTSPVTLAASSAAVAATSSTTPPPLVASGSPASGVAVAPAGGAAVTTAPPHGAPAAALRGAATTPGVAYAQLRKSLSETTVTAPLAAEPGLPPLLSSSAVTTDTTAVVTPAASEVAVPSTAVPVESFASGVMAAPLHVPAAETADAAPVPMLPAPPAAADGTAPLAAAAPAQTAPLAVAAPAQTAPLAAAAPTQTAPAVPALSAAAAPRATVLPPPPRVAAVARTSAVVAAPPPPPIYMRQFFMPFAAAAPTLSSSARQRSSTEVRSSRTAPLPYTAAFNFAHDGTMTPRTHVLTSFLPAATKPSATAAAAARSKPALPGLAAKLREVQADDAAGLKRAVAGVKKATKKKYKKTVSGKKLVKK